MRILFDKNVPVGVRRFLSGHEVRKFFDLGWHPQLENGDRLRKKLRHSDASTHRKSVNLEKVACMYAVMGITGNVGGAIANTLLKHGKQVRGIVRNEAKAQAWKDRGVELVVANYDANLGAAFTGVEGIFAMIPPNLTPDPGFPDSTARIAAIKNAVIAAKPPRAVFLSSIGSEKDSGLGLITTTHILEEQLGSTGVPSAFLRAGSFMENILHSIPAARATGQYFAFYQPLEHSYPLIATGDIGRIGAETLLQPGKETASSKSPVQPTIPQTTLLSPSEKPWIGLSPRLLFPVRPG